MIQFRGGPLEDGPNIQVHSLVLHMRGDGRYSVGTYVQVYDDKGQHPVAFEWYADDVDGQPTG